MANAIFAKTYLNIFFNCIHFMIWINSTCLLLQFNLTIKQNLEKNENSNKTFSIRISKSNFREI